MNPRGRRRSRGFSLIEVLVAMGLLASLMVSVAVSQGDAMYRAVEVMNLTNASQIVDTIVLNVEEEYRLEGFPTNQVEGRNCREFLPKGFERYTCEYDLLMLDTGSDAMNSMGADAMDKVSNSSLINTFCGGADGGGAMANMAAVCAQFQSVSGVGLPIELIAFAPLCDPGLNQLCGVNIGQMCQNTQLITSFIPTIVEQAAAATRKLRINLSWDDEGLVMNEFTIETFITAVPEAEPEQ